MKQLQPNAPALQAVYDRIKVKAVNEGALYTKYERELKTMVEGLDSFIINGTVAVAEADAIKADAADDEPMKTLKVKLVGMTTNAEHHLGGAKGAKTMFPTSESGWGQAPWQERPWHGAWERYQLHRKSNDERLQNSKSKSGPLTSICAFVIGKRLSIVDLSRPFSSAS